MKRFVRKELPLAMTVAIATLIVVAVTGAKGDAVILIMGSLMAIPMIWERLHEPPKSDDAPRARSGGGRSTGSR
jgi:hypothetical protein